MPNITPWLWFDKEAQEAAEYYTSIFPNSKITEVTHYGEAGPRPAGSVLTVTFELEGKQFAALNGGPEFTFNEAVSFLIDCADQEEVDFYWGRLGDGGEHGPCGWLKDRYGLSWQVVPRRLEELMRDSDPEIVRRVTDAMLQMGKLEVAKLEDAAAGARA
jgi:predicted 3-demethylubiquinone-9 3-methyltransferase (glyoxalase superfamily)